MEKSENSAVLRNAVALCAVGAEKAVSNEIKKLELSVIDSGFGRVRFRSDIAGLYKALIGLRAADRVLLEAQVFPATDFDALFEGAMSTPWERLIPADMGIKIVKVRSNRSALKAETSIQSIVHKAVAECLCTAYKLPRLPEKASLPEKTSLPETATVAEIRVYIEKDVVSLLLDLSGDPLYKRGYRIKGGVAPLRETTAAAMLLLSGWKRKYPLYDPFCGSGTMLIEALMYAWDFAPGLCRNFALDNLLIADNKIEESVRSEFSGKINYERIIRIAGSDEDAASVKLAETNVKRIKSLAGSISLTPPENITTPLGLQVSPMKEARAPFQESDQGFIVTNPPYGKRLGDPVSSEQTYGEMYSLARQFSGWKLVLITDHAGFESFFGRKADSCREIKNGPIASYIFQYDGL